MTLSADKSIDELLGSQPSTRSVHEAVAAIAAGGMVVVIDDADRENEGDLIVPAATVTTEQAAFMVQHTTGILCAPMTGEHADALQLPQMVASNTDLHGTAFTVTVDHVDSGTGVSATDRARTLRALADPASRPEHFRRPGHIFPLRARDGGVLVRRGHTEAAVDLMTLAGHEPVAVIGEIVAPDGSMRRGEHLRQFAQQYGLPVLAIDDLVRYRRSTERLVTPVASSTMPTEFGNFRAVAYRSTLDGVEHLALVLGDMARASASEQGALVRVHSECLTGDALGSLRCDCGGQLKQATRLVAEEGCGAVVYLRGHEGRGIGLAHKIRAYALQDDGLDTIDANIAQGLPVDARSYGVGVQILRDLGIRRMRLITNNPAKYGGLAGHGIDILGRVALQGAENPHNAQYLRTKRERLGHDLGAPSQAAGQGQPFGSHEGEGWDDVFSRGNIQCF
ncbi:bifunctional 3,4-dihydroxy-2-butanone-4-phosphate synthase/GTP cyclohydrolase II (plasmid) [Rhodococcus oxybenzonivorans]|uniref:Riboflavin biosynthesis protein RibBA n=1 Tax=Rhodococcus oxybenzonivorans TaxID=1990687 RepID=A0A2S2C5U6_9NOCA|nr:bifunctional 3,4-dihydroxy-2-butanone-4-phosphate synthase/GTP cyclohydrolase II [Rhodococcus oxybenzonivorans]AWK76267.1 bifunctional 3,4-dihydroxy-2-butanone-4-phosphate synthase/GTP cyclohydrolase II [Rhodococcus oxybenzonivorans]